MLYKQSEFHTVFKFFRHVQILLDSIGRDTVRIITTTHDTTREPDPFLLTTVVQAARNLGLEGIYPFFQNVISSVFMTLSTLALNESLAFNV